MVRTLGLWCCFRESDPPISLTDLALRHLDVVVVTRQNPDIARTSCLLYIHFLKGLHFSAVHRGSERERRDSSTLFIGNLPYHFRERDLGECFERCGPIKSVTIGINKRTGQ